MTLHDPHSYKHWEGAVAFRLFADNTRPTLTAAEQIAVTVGDRIISGALAPQARILEQDLADEFDVSRGPIRDALHILEREGLVMLIPRRGAVVTDLTADEVRDIFEIRAGLIEVVARKIIARTDKDTIALLKSGVARLQTLAALDDDKGEYAETSYRLSILAARACGNPRLAQMVTALSLQTLRYAKLSLASQPRRRQSAKNWADAMAALDAGDIEGYARLARERVEASGREAARLLSSTSPPT